jgi:hypothetical protein
MEFVISNACKREVIDVLEGFPHFGFWIVQRDFVWEMRLYAVGVPWSKARRWEEGMKL